MGVIVRERDNGAKALLKRLRAVAGKRPSVTVGIDEEEGSEPEGDSGATVAEVAAMHELGLGQEQRSFVRAYVDENEAQLASDLSHVGVAFLNGKEPDIEQGLERFGAKAAAGMRGRITGGELPANDPETVEQKGSSTPLIDEGNLVAAITHKVQK